MLPFILRRLTESIPLLLAILTITFVLVKLAPGDPLADEKMTPEQLAKERAYYGYDKPLYQQYWKWIKGLPSGDLGITHKHPGWTVGEIIRDRIPVSLELGLHSLIVALIIGISAGLVAAIKPNTITDFAPMAFAMIGICLPTFVIGPLLALVFGLHFEWFNVWGWILPEDRVLPSLTLGFYYPVVRTYRTRKRCHTHNCLLHPLSSQCTIPHYIIRWTRCRGPCKRIFCRRNHFSNTRTRPDVCRIGNQQGP